MNKFVVDLETAKKLKDYLPEGWESKFSWVYYPALSDKEGWGVELTKGVVEFNEIFRKSTLDHIGEELSGVEFHQAPILEEMLELMPRTVRHVNNEEGWFEDCNLHLDKDSIYYKGKEDWVLVQPDYEKNTNLATAAARLFMWLVDEGLAGGEG